MNDIELIQKIISNDKDAWSYFINNKIQPLLKKIHYWCKYECINTNNKDYDCYFKCFDFNSKNQNPSNTPFSLSKIPKKRELNEKCNLCDEGPDLLEFCLQELKKSRLKSFTGKGTLEGFVAKSFSYCLLSYFEKKFGKYYLPKALDSNALDKENNEKSIIIDDIDRKIFKIITRKKCFNLETVLNYAEQDNLKLTLKELNYRYNKIASKLGKDRWEYLDSYILDNSMEISITQEFDSEQSDIDIKSKGSLYKQLFNNIENKEIIEILENILNELKDSSNKDDVIGYRIIKLKYYDELTLKEISEKLSIIEPKLKDTNAVNNKLNSTMKKVTNRIGELLSKSEIRDLLNQLDE
jgi:hypothetical protein